MPLLSKVRIETCLWGLATRMMLLILEREVLMKCAPKSMAVCSFRSEFRDSFWKSSTRKCRRDRDRDQHRDRHGANKERVGIEPYLRGFTFTCCSQSYGLSSSNVWMWELDHKDWAPKNCCFQIGGAREDSCKSLGQQGDHASHSQVKSILNIH